ncbi:MAG: ActS/PrrB/RegB family redox-sensitive histidine kinase [Rhizobiaceae bacterium]|nr:ActS/PrrB/RegB family redox-sensitive histidine kinase [Rhizobiaceae bacterium]
MPAADYPGILGNPASNNLRLETLTKIRWLAIFGQTVAVLVVWLLLDFQFHPAWCFVLIAASAFLNAFLTIRYPSNIRLSERSSTVLLTYDILQLALLLFLTGGLGNPFSFLLLVPVFISATTQSISSTVILGLIAMGSATILAFFHLPLPWIQASGLELPWIYIAGMWFAVISSLLFTAVYAFRVADESRQLADALAATELVLQREQHLSNIDGLAAAAAHELGTPLATISLVAKEMSREFDTSSPMYDDVKLLRSQADRCREIMKTLTSLSNDDDKHLSVVSLRVLLEEVCEPHRNFGVDVSISASGEQQKPLVSRNPAILYGLGNIVENAVDHAEQNVKLVAGWDKSSIWVTINDDGSGFHDEMIRRIGEPFLSSRSTMKPEGGLGLGLFIAKTLLERSGATTKFENAKDKALEGASVTIRWPRSALEVSRSAKP